MKNSYFSGIIKILITATIVMLIGTYILYLYFHKSFLIVETVFILVLLVSMVVAFKEFIKKSIHKKNQYDESNARLLNGIKEISQSIISIQGEEQLFQIILEKAVEIIDNAEMGSLMILNNNNMLEYKALVGFEPEKFINFKLKLEDTFLYRTYHGNVNRACYVDNVEAFDREVLDDKTFEIISETVLFLSKSAISAPIIVNGVLYGMINVDSKRYSAFNEENITLMEYFANQAGVVIHLHQMMERMQFLSQYDRLTSVYNRGYFEELFEDYFKKSKRHFDSFTVVVFDLNNLKKTNDTYGHQVGDILIKTFAHYVQQSMTSNDIFARYGGDEFIGVYYETSKDSLEDRIKQYIQYFDKNPISTDAGQISIEFSYGMASFPEDSSRINQLLAIADNRMYKYKSIKKDNKLT